MTVSPVLAQDAGGIEVASNVVEGDHVGRNRFVRVVVCKRVVVF